MSIKVSRQLLESPSPVVRKLKGTFPEDSLAPGRLVTIAADPVPRQQPSRNRQRFNGRVCVLIGPHSTSVSTYFAEAVQRSGVGTLVGEETGDPTSCYGNSLAFTLPNSALPGEVASVYLVYLGSKRDGRGAIPDYEVKPSREDIALAVDAVFGFALGLIKGGRSPQARRTGATRSSKEVSGKESGGRARGASDDGTLPPYPRASVRVPQAEGCPQRTCLRRKSPSRAGMAAARKAPPPGAGRRPSRLPEKPSPIRQRTRASCLPASWPVRFSASRYWARAGQPRAEHREKGDGRWRAPGVRSSGRMK